MNYNATRGNARPAGSFPRSHRLSRAAGTLVTHTVAPEGATASTPTTVCVGGPACMAASAARLRTVLCNSDGVWMWRVDGTVQLWCRQHKVPARAGCGMNM